MKKYSKIVFLAIFIALISVNFQFGGLEEVRAEQCYYPFMYLDKADEVYNHAVCQSNFQVYYFPVVADGRKYTITLHSIEGEQKLYASRYKNDVDELSDLTSWICSDDHCDSSTEINSTTKVVAFRAPTGEDGYYSWFTVYGTTASKYQIGISNSGVLSYVSTSQYKTSSVTNDDTSSTGNTSTAEQNTSASSGSNIQWMAISPEPIVSLTATDWTKTDFAETGWQKVAVPNSENWRCDDCYRRYRGTFYLSDSANLKASFSSDDGIWLYINGQYLGHWGGDSESPLMCVNNSGCKYNQTANDVDISQYLKQGKNIISAIIYDGGDAEYFNLRLKSI